MAEDDLPHANADLPHPHANVEPQNYKDVFKGRVESKFADPCAKAAEASFKCMDMNNYDRTLCMDYFEAYRECKAAWIGRRKDDRRNGSTD